MRSGRCRVSECEVALWSRSGTTIVTRPRRDSSSRSGTRAGACTPSSLAIRMCIVRVAAAAAGSRHALLGGAGGGAHLGWRVEPLAGEAREGAEDPRHVAERMDLALLVAVDGGDLDLGHPEPEP